MITIQTSPFITSSFRCKLLKMGVEIGTHCFIGSDITFDGIHPELTVIGSHTKITSGTKILTHFFNPVNNAMRLGKVTIGDNVFIGINTLIVNPVNIGDGAVLAAGSVVVCDILSWEIWGGNPAKFIKKRVAK